MRAHDRGLGELEKEGQDTSVLRYENGLGELENGRKDASISRYGRGHVDLTKEETVQKTVISRSERGINKADLI
jgi:hypothetical protein